MEALYQMAKYAKFLNDLLTNKRKFKEIYMVLLIEASWALLQNQLPRKKKDRCSFTIPYNIDDLVNEKDLVDLGADVDEDVEEPLILGQPFLAIFEALFDVSNSRMTLRIGDVEVVFALSDAMKYSFTFNDTCYFMDMSDSIVDEYVQEMVHKEPCKESLDDP
ncbi:uncharacterized protein LOC120271577 [Dioscorea cayenensis subsp. rotundata]|uniref:Uncharacterized protein LOC120271577 n=1 Tax=Dioscorea cayennensis subsp. rotundata TaxID=55577 RepID=A0AB40C5V9_DIOCR|nr:uncharacterized protein LOC120271577 [Dioscorea cayenensis subsp. rotundata]